MENVELDRVKSLELLRELQVEHKSIKNNPELVEIQQKVNRHKKKEENFRYKPSQDQDQIQELRQKFQNALNKLNSIDTRQVALKEAQSLIKSRNSLESLKVYISSLTDHRKSKDSSARELEVSLLGYLSEVYKENLVEEGNSLKLLIRLAEVVQSYFKDLNRGVHRAAGTALCDMYRYSLPKSTQAVIFSFMFDPLQSILTTGIDVQVQQAAALTLFIWVEYLKEDNDQGNLVLLYAKIVPLFLKLRADFVDLLNAIGLLSETCGFQILIENLPSFLSKMNLYLNHSSANAYPLKTAACQLLSHIGKFLLETNFKLEPFPSEILASLRVVKTEKVPVLQNKARETLKIWDILKASLLEQPVELVASPKVIKRIEPENHFRSIRNLVKLQKEKMRAAEEKKPESVWGMQKAGFLKKGTGNYFNPSAVSNVSHSKVFEKRKDFVAEIRKKQISPEGVKILYKENNRVVLYDEPFAPQLFKHESFHPDFQVNSASQGIAKASRRAFPGRPDEQQNSRIIEKSDEEHEFGQEKSESKRFEFQFEKNPVSTEHINELAAKKFESNTLASQKLDKNSLDANSSCKETDNTENMGKNLESPGKKISLNPEKAEIFSFFVQEQLKSTELQNPSIKKPDQSSVLGPSDDLEASNLLPSEPGKVLSSKPASHDFTLNPSQKLESSANHKHNDSSFSRFQNEIQTMKSLTIEIKPMKRHIIRDLSIQNQEPFKVSQKQVKTPENTKRPSLNLEKQPAYQIKGIHSKEVQTSANFHDTPRFSLSLQSEPVETRNTTEILEPIIQNLEDIREEIDEKFLKMGNLLQFMEERLTWVDESCKLVKKYKKTRKTLKNDGKNLKNDVKTCCRSQQTDEVKKNEGFAPVDRLTHTWSNILQMTEDGKVSNAYSSILETADDLYLLRLMFKTQPCFQQLGQNLSSKVVLKLLTTLESKFVENIGIQWIVAALNEGVDISEEVVHGIQNIESKGGKEAEDAKKILSYIQEVECFNCELK